MANDMKAAAAVPVKKLRTPKKKIQDTTGDKILEAITTLILILITIAVAYPVVYVVSASFSSNNAILSGRVVLWPVDFTLDGYKMAFNYDTVIMGYKNTLFYTFFGTIIKVVVQVMCAYPLSKMHFQGRKAYTRIIVLTMLVSAGMIPLYLVRVSLGLINNVWAILLAGIVSASNVFILRTAFRSSIPGELFDAAEIDGANDFQCLVKIAVPLAKATISVITLYAIVGCWNEYMTALIYLPARQDLWPLQLILRQLLLLATTVTEGNSSSSSGGTTASSGTDGLAMMRYSLIVIATVPVLIAYGFVQKFFKGGVMVGSVKG